MRAASTITGLVVLAAALLGQAPCLAQTVIDADFSRGDFAELGFKAKGDWDLFLYPKKAANNPGRVARFGANKPDGSLTKSFSEVKTPQSLALSLDYGWGWGDATQGADSISFMLLDGKDNGYAFKVHRCKAKWAVQWGRVAGGTPAKDMTWAPEDIDASHASVRDGGGLSRLTVERQPDGTWTVACKDWNKGAGAAVTFLDTTTSSFSRLVLLGTKNFDEQAFGKVVLKVKTAATPGPVTAIPAADFLSSIGVVSTFPDRGQPLAKTIDMVRYCGFRWVRGGIEGLTERGPTTVHTYLDLHERTGARFSWGLVSGGSDLKKLLDTAQPLAKAGALLAFEGNNEPNNWGVTYEGNQGGGRAPTWLPVARLQRDLYKAVKSDPLLKKYPVWSLSENGAQVDNVGLQFLTIPSGAGTLMPEGTRYADFANVHNYIYHPGSPGLEDNKSWKAADPGSTCKVDGLYGNYGRTWAKHYRGYTEAQLRTLPRVTTETGCTIGGPITEEIQALNLMSMYLDQYRRGWRHTAVYLLRDRTDEGGNQTFGFFKRDYAPRKAAVYLHNLTTILADRGAPAALGRLSCAIVEQPPTTHEMLLQKSDGTYYWVVWSERLKGADEVTVRLGATFPSVKVYDPTVGTEAVRTHRDVDSLKLTLSDHPLILALAAK
jgi:hypothetical protein